jgi:LDH2 family malate/lactate/ureidoglycolate dehydrogenase
LLPPDCLLDRSGQPTQDAASLSAGGVLLPLGGAVAGHKGSGLAMASALIGALGMIGDAEPTLVGAAPDPAITDTRGRIGGVFVQVIDPACFGDPAGYRAMVEAHLAAAKRMPAAPGREDVLVPGEPESRSRDRRGQEGIPVAAATWTELGKVAARFAVPLPDARMLG